MSALIGVIAISLLTVLLAVAMMTFGNFGDGGGAVFASFLFLLPLGLAAPGLLLVFGLTILIYRRLSPRSVAPSDGV